MQPKHILIIGNYGSGNLGDDAILGGILTDLQAIGYDGAIEITHGGFQTSPEIYADLPKITFVPVGLRSRLRKNNAKEAIQKADLVILGGGGLFVDSESWKAPLIWAKQAAACHRLGTPYICYGQSVGPLKHWLSRYLTRKTFKNAKAIHVRDQGSAKILRKLGITDVTVGTDPAFSWIAEQNSLENKDHLIIVLREWNQKAKDSWNEILEKTKEFAAQKNLKPVLMAMDPRNSKELKALKETGLHVLEPKSALEALKHIKEAKATVSMRLHSSIFAIAAGIPLLALSYSPKVEALMQSLGAKHAVTNLENLNLKILENFQKIAIPPKLIKQNQAFLEDALTNHEKWVQ